MLLLSVRLEIRDTNSPALLHTSFGGKKNSLDSGVTAAPNRRR